MRAAACLRQGDFSTAREHARRAVDGPSAPYRRFAFTTLARALRPLEAAAALTSGEYFDVGPNARYLSTVGHVKPAHRERFAAATLSGDLIRVHAVDREDNPLYWKLLHAAGESTGLPVLYNTSFNLLFMNMLLITIPPLVMFMFFQKQIVAGMTAGSVKG